jgi:hypothetical protein
MASKLQKPRLKRRSNAGRPPKEGVERFPSGKIKPSETIKETLSTAMWGRKNVHKLETDSPFAGYTLGRMFLDGKITEEERKAGEYYADCMARYYSSVGIPHPSPRAQNFGTIRGHDGDVTESQQTRARRASNKMMELEGLLCGLPSGRQIKTTIFNLCIMDYENMRSMPETQLRYLKDGLRALRMHQCLREAA